MKRIFLILVFTLSLACTFVICVSATVVISEKNIDENGDIVADLICKASDTEEQHICSVDITYTTKTGETKSSKLYYLIGLWTQQNKRQIETIYVPSDFDMAQTVYFFDKIDVNGDGEYDFNELIKGTRGSAFYIKSYVSFANNSFVDTVDVKQTELQAISYSKYLTYFGSNTFSSCAALNSVTYNGCELEDYTCIISPSVDSVMSGAFGGDGRSLDSNLISANFTRLVFEDRNGSVSFDQYCFTRNELTEIVFGAGKYNLNGQDRIALLYKTENTNETCLERVVVSKDTVIASGNISWCVGSYDVIVLGLESECAVLYEANCKKALPNASSVTYSPCYFGHTEIEDDGDCTTAVVCPACREYEYKSAISHVMTEGAEYSNYFENGIHFVGCGNVGCEVKTETALSPLVESLGYSCTTFGDALAMVQGYKINKEAISAYKVFKPELEIGFVAAHNQTGEAFSPDFASGNVISSPINLVNDYINTCVKGIEEENSDAVIVFCLYVKDENNVFFLDNGATENSVVGVSYNQVNYATVGSNQ